MPRIPVLNQKNAIAVDVELMKSPGFSIYQLMELAALSVATAVFDAYPSASNILALAGPGNNGGDALVAARHLKHFGMNPTVIYPKIPNKPLFLDLQAQMEQLSIPVLKELPNAEFLNEFDVILDGIFGFSFKPGNIREPFGEIIEALLNTSVPIASIDIPSGWDVEQGDQNLEVCERYLQPEFLISLTAPKECAKYFKGPHHYLGGRFVPPFIVEKYGLGNLPKYPGTQQFLKIVDPEYFSPANL
eukprot:maker-scaffold_7-snap-gene-11.52-mRNA-1 protein AED:0.01 eAED:0.01 QI:235/1/1/1/1/1/2/890/245